MPTTTDIIKGIGVAEELGVVLIGLIKGLKNLISGSDQRTVDALIDEADRNWDDVIARAKKELGQS